MPLVEAIDAPPWLWPRGSRIAALLRQRVDDRTSLATEEHFFCLTTPRLFFDLVESTLIAHSYQDGRYRSKGSRVLGSASRGKGTCDGRGPHCRRRKTDPKRSEARFANGDGLNWLTFVAQDDVSDADSAADAVRSFI